ncbi:MAG: hypothetical protein HUU08_16605 [Candidatus Brocadia sp.]|nr:hypothetical protein [Candidatus Brocadia sp.]
MEKKITIKESKDRCGFVSPLEFSDDFSEDEKTNILNLYFQEMVRALIENKNEEEFVESIKNRLRSNKYTVIQSVSATLTFSWNILGPLPEMMMYSASKFLKENHAWPPNLAAVIIFCINALEISVNIKLIDKFNTMGRSDKARLVKDDRSLSLEDKFSWLLTDAFNSSLKVQNILWTWLDNIKKMRNEIIHLKKDSDGTDIVLKDKEGNIVHKLDEVFTKNAIEHTQKILTFLEKL